MTETLQSILDRLAVLERENARLVAALDAQRTQVAATAGGAIDRTVSITSRRGLLHAAAAVAAGATAALVAAGPKPAGADNGQAFTLGQVNTATSRSALAVTQNFIGGTYGFGVVDKQLDAGFPIEAALAGHTAGLYYCAVLGFAEKGQLVTGVTGISESDDTRSVGVYGYARHGTGVWGQAPNGDAVHGLCEADSSGGAGVHAVHSGFGYALLAENKNKDSGYYVIEATTAGDGGVIHAAANAGPAVQGQSKSGDGVEGSSDGAGIGVAGLSNKGTGVYARSSSGESLRAEVLSGDSTAAAIHARHSGRGKAVLAEITNPLTSATAVSAKTRGTGAAVIGKSAQGHGGIFGGKQAPLRLLPRGRTHPRAGALGDLYVDTAGRLWFCTKTGNPAAWRQLA